LVFKEIRAHAMLINFQLLDHQVLVRHTNDIRGDGSSLFDQYMLSIAL